MRPRIIQQNYLVSICMLMAGSSDWILEKDKEAFLDDFAKQWRQKAAELFEEWEDWED